MVDELKVGDEVSVGTSEDPRLERESCYASVEKAMAELRKAPEPEKVGSEAEQNYEENV